MRNRKLLITLLVMAILLVGIVVLLRQTNTQNDTPLANNGDKPKTEKPTKTDPEKTKKQKSTQQPGNTPKIKELQKGNTGSTAKAASNNNSNVQFVRGINKTTQNKSKPVLNNQTRRAHEITRLKNEIKQEINPAEKAKLQKRLNSLQ